MQFSTLSTRARWARFAPLALVLAAACSDEPGILPTDSVASARAAAGGDLVTSDPAALAERVRQLGNQNELLVVLKDAATPGVNAQALLDLPLKADLVVGIPAGRGAGRGNADMTKAGAEARNGVLNALAAHGVTPYNQAGELPIFAVRIPEDRLVPVLNVLLRHPAVDYVEANQKRPVELSGTPVGSNPLDDKHTFHNVQLAWDYTRGAGAKVGVLDTGFANERSTNTWHPDGQLITPSSGIDKRGFSDDYPQLSGCSVYNGACVPWDDQGHGTYMTGLVGANDNALGSVGIMPDGLTISMKIISNDFVSGSGCGYTRTDCIEDDDFVGGIDWAMRNRLDVLSMSFTTQFGSSVFNALKSAYDNYDIFLVAATGNPNQPSGGEPVEFNFVYGAAGLDASGNNFGHQVYKDFAALSGGYTTNPYCPSAYSFCSPNGSSTLVPTSGGTSSSTAIIAGIAGLLRAYRPLETAAQTRARLVNTMGVNGRVNAYAAITY
ncbi:MAG TPA: S8 family serine peptidase [Longimicrobium sp.]|nr:S8 family serine peptidase [Longimicrobium sp.]